MLDKSNIEITIHYYQDGKKFRFMLKSKRHIFHPAQARNPPGKKMLSSFLSQCKPVFFSHIRTPLAMAISMLFQARVTDKGCQAVI